MKSALILFLMVHCIASKDQDETEISNRIYKGKNAARGQFPFQALLLGHSSKSITGYCSGALISPSYVLTAAQCCYRILYTDVYLGVTDTKDNDFIHQVVSSNDTYIHPLYNPEKFKNDIALLKLQFQFSFSGFIRSINLPRRLWSSPYTFDHYDVVASGWGQSPNNNNKFHRILKYSRLNKMRQESCKLYYNNVLPIANTMICTDKKVVYDGPCVGDSGGPLTVLFQSEIYLLGLVSWGVGNCSSKNPVVYTYVAKYLIWISSTTGLPIFI